MAHDFAEKEIRPVAWEYDEHGTWPQEIIEKAWELGLMNNHDPDSTLPYLVRLPLNDGLVFRTSGTWPRTKALYCHPVGLGEWPDEPEVVERTRVRSCVRRGAAIDLVLERGRENRSQVVFTTARGREMVFWQSPQRIIRGLCIATLNLPTF